MPSLCVRPQYTPHMTVLPTGAPGGAGAGAVPHAPSASAPQPPLPPSFAVPASIALDVSTGWCPGTITAAKLDLLLPQAADDASLTALAADLCGPAHGRLAGREGDVRSALAASLGPFAGAGGVPSPPTHRRLVTLQFTAAAGRVRLTDRVVVDLGAPPGAECGASLGVAIAGDAGLSDAAAAAYASAFAAALAAARAGRAEGVLPLEAAKGWVPRVERAEG